MNHASVEDFEESDSDEVKHLEDLPGKKSGDGEYNESGVREQAKDSVFDSRLGSDDEEQSHGEDEILELSDEETEDELEREGEDKKRR
jgi:hypothetical protein